MSASASSRLDDQPAPALWRREQVAAIAHPPEVTAPIITAADVVRVAADIDIWDAWPLQDAAGAPVVLGGGVTLWMALGAPHFADPDERHGHARIYLLQQGASGWHLLGPAMPDLFSPGSREWSGSAVLAPDGRTLSLFFTATGRRGEPTQTFEQRLFGATADLTMGERSHALTGWRDLREIVVRDPVHYMASDAGAGGVGTIKAFRDPAYFRDPADGAEYLFFAASRANTASRFNGVVGVAERKGVGDSWTIRPPIIDATGLNNELERPHVVCHDGRYYLFWSTQTHVFDPAGHQGPTGLYGMVADRLSGPWEPLNGTGLAFANPVEAPRQAYSWLVLPDLSVISFIDDWGTEPAQRPRRFGATFAPVLNLVLDGAHARLAR